MHFDIASRFRPFSHRPETQVPIPYADAIACIFPARIILEKTDIPLNIQGPVLDFTVCLDLERGVVQVAGKSLCHFRYYLFAANKRLMFFQDRGEAILPVNHPFVIMDHLPALPHLERLSLGVSKQLNWDAVKQRASLAELLPIWFYLGQMFEDQGTPKEPSLLKTVLDTSGISLNQAFLNLFHAGFSGIFSPRKVDHDFLGFSLNPIGLNDHPFLLLTAVYQKIRSLIGEEKNHQVFILPAILTHFPSGRVKGLKFSFGKIDIEWTKNRLRRVIIRVDRGACVSFVFPKGLKSCRMMSTGGLKTTLKTDGVLDLRENTHYFLSRFEN